jgi:hypothetical protein
VLAPVRRASFRHRVLIAIQARLRPPSGAATAVSRIGNYSWSGTGMTADVQQ